MVNAINAVYYVKHVKMTLKLVQVVIQIDILKILNANHAPLFKDVKYAKMTKFVLNVNKGII